MPHPRNPGMTSLSVSGTMRKVRCWRVTPAVAGYPIIRLTEHDSPLTFGGETFSPGAGLQASAVSTNEGLRASNTEFRGYLTSDLFRPEDFRSGIYLRARIDEFLVDHRFPWAGVDRPMTYRVGQTQWNPRLGSFVVDVSSVVGDFDAKFGDVYTRDCPATLGDDECGVNIEALAKNGTVTAVTDRGTFSASLSGGEGVIGYFSLGKLKWTAGNNNNLLTFVRSYTPGAWVLHVPAPRNIVIGDTFRVYPGCNKRSGVNVDGSIDPTGHCIWKFNNLNRFRGFPYLPTNDKILITPDVKH